MQFIEEIFHVAPDGGSGILEMSIVMALLSIPTVIFAVRRRAKRNARTGPASTH